MSINEDISLKKSFFYNQVSQITHILRLIEDKSQVDRGDGRRQKILTLVDNVGVGTSSLNSLSLLKTFVDKLVMYKEAHKC